VSERSTYSQSPPSMDFFHDSSQVMKFVYMPSHCSVAQLNKTLKLEMHLLKELVFILLTHILVCAEYAFETFGVTNDKIRLMSFSIKQPV
jgi:hypothetical protein